jgi:hypothetical protein
VATEDPLELARRGGPEMIEGNIFSAAVTLQYRRRCIVHASYVTVPEKVVNSLANSCTTKFDLWHSSHCM